MPANPPPEYLPFPNEQARNSRQQSLEIPLMITALGLPCGARVLEVGCGRGFGLTVLARRLLPTRLVGLDVDTALLHEARERVMETGTAAELLPADVRSMPLPDASFDLIIDFGTCYHIGRPAEALHEIARVLAPGGLFVEETPLSQLLSHPVRAFGRSVPWRSEPRLHRARAALLWSSRRRVAPA